MSSDPRTMRGVTVHQRMQQQAATERAWQARAEALRYAAQLQQQHIAAAEAIYAQHGWQGLREAIAADGVSEAALEWITDRLVENRGSLAGLGQTLSAEIQHEAIAQQRFEAAREDLTKRVETAVQDATPAEGDTRGTRGAKEASRRAQLLRDKSFHERVAALLAPRYESLAAQGLGLVDGESPGAWFLRIAEMLGPDATASVNAERMPGSQKWTPDQALVAASRVFQADPAELRELLAQAAGVEVNHALHKRLGERDDQKPQIAPPEARDQARIDGEAARRKVLEDKAAQIEATPPTVAERIKAQQQTPTTPPAPSRPAAPSRRQVLSEGIDAIREGRDPVAAVGRQAPEAPPAPPPPSREETTSEERRSTLSAAYDALAAEGEEPEA